MYWVLKHDLRGTGSLQASHRDLTASLWDCSRASASHSTPPSKTVLCAVSNASCNGSKGEQVTGTSEKLALVPLVVSQMVYQVRVLEGDFLSVPGVFCSAPLSKATDTRSLQGEHGSTLAPWTNLWLSRILLSLSRKF